MNENPTFYEFSNRVKRETLQTRGSFFPLDRRDEYIYIDCVIRTGIPDIISRNKEIFVQPKKKKNTCACLCKRQVIRESRDY